MTRILLIDPDKITLNATSLILAEAGFETDGAANLDEARKRIVATEYGVAITDLDVAGVDGSRIIAALKKIRPSTEVVVMTASGTLDAAVACMRAGAGDFLLKPCKREQLLEAVRKAVAKKELSQQNLMLRSLNEMKDKFLTLVSHELRTPLTLIYGYLTILQRQSASFSDDQVGLLNIILKSSKQLIGIVNNIQTIAQADSGEFQLHLQDVWPRKLLADVLAEMKASSTERKLELRLEEGAELEAFAGDLIRLHQSLAELVQNALRNTNDGGWVVIGAEDRDQHVVLWVKDNGIGIPEEEQGKVFEPFYEVADVSLHTSSNCRFGGGGIGIGLPLVKRVVEAHQGMVRLTSEPGKGTLVELILPRRPLQKGADFQDRL
ncbi:MAG: ATP-binding protein [candidate division FCPU426 bacterium]